MTTLGVVSQASAEEGGNARLAAKTLMMAPCAGIPSWMLHVMDMAFMEHRTGRPPGAFRADPDGVYCDFQRKVGACMIDQYLATNPLTLSAEGFGHDATRGATTGSDSVVLDGIVIDSSESVAEHLERVVFPRLEHEIAATGADDAQAVTALIEGERAVADLLGPSILKVPYGDCFCDFPRLRYTEYGYAPYLTAFVVYPEIMERDFALQADLAERRNARAAKAILEAGLPRVIRADHDMAEGHGTLVDVRMLDRMWFPHFARAVRSLLDAGIRLLWHCDGNLMEMTPRLIEAGIGGFQGFQYECGMDYARICRMHDRDGGPLMIWAGVSVTRTLPFGTPSDVRDELAWLVREGPATGLFLGASSSITPGVPWANLDTLIEGLGYFRTHGR